MATKKASLKSIKQSAKHEMHNQAIKSKIRTYLKKVNMLVEQKQEGVKEVACKCISILDKAAKIGIIHSNKVSRHKRSMAKLIF